MRTRTITLLLALIALAVPLAAATAPAKEQASAAKKKLSYCQKRIKKEKAKTLGKVKAAKFYLAITKRPIDYFFCSESPKFNGKIEAWDGVKKTSSLRAVKNNCAIFFTESKRGTAWDAGSKELKVVAAKFFKKGAVKQTQGSTLGFKDDTVSLASLKLSKNCVFAAGYVLNGVPKIQIAGIGNFPYQGYYTKVIPTASLAELKAIKVTATSKTTAQVSWTQGGVPTTLNYPADVQ